MISIICFPHFSVWFLIISDISQFLSLISRPAREAHFLGMHICIEYLHIIPLRLVAEISFIDSFMIPVYLQQYTARDRYKPPADQP